MATCMRDNARRATLEGTPSRSTQAGARHRERAELTFFFPSSPLISAIAVLSSSPSPVSPPSATVDATTTASASFSSLHSGFHRPRHRSPSSYAAVAVLFSSHLLASVAILPVSSITVTFPLPFPPPPSPPSILPLRSPRPNAVAPPPLFPLHLVTVPAVSFFLSTSDYYLNHRRRLPSLFLSPAPPSASRHHLPLLPLLQAHESSHRQLPPSPFPPPSTIELLSPFSLFVAVIPTPSPSSSASTDADLPLLSLSSLLHLVVGSLLLLPITDPTSISPSAASLAPLRLLHRLQTATTSLLPPRPHRSPCRRPRLSTSSPSSASIAEHHHEPPLPASPPSPFPPASTMVNPLSPPFWFGWVKVAEEGDELCLGRSVGSVWDVG